MSYFAFDKFVPVVVGEGASTENETKKYQLKLGRTFDELLGAVINSRSVDDQSVPLSFDVVV